MRLRWCMGDSRNITVQYPPILRLQSETGSEDVYYSLCYEGLPEEYKLRAEKELNETDEKKRKGLQNLREYAKSENIIGIADSVLLAVLRGCKYDIKKSKTKFKKFLAKRKEIAEILAKVGVKKLEHIMEATACGLLPYRDKLGRVILYTRPYGMESDLYDIEDIAACTVAVTLFTLTFPMTSVSGFVYFGECKAPSLYIFYPILKQFKRYMWYPLSLPIRTAKVEILNANYLAHWFFKMVSPLLPEKIAKRVSFYNGGYDILHKLYDPNMLPDAFGGNLGPLTNEHFKERFLEFASRLIEEYQ